LRAPLRDGRSDRVGYAWRIVLGAARRRYSCASREPTGTLFQYVLAASSTLNPSGSSR
jgi:hypothetical protein